MNVKERNVHVEDAEEWSWIKGSVTLSVSPLSASRSALGDGSKDDGENTSIDYNLFGLHHVPNGTINLFGLPEGMRIDIRNIPRLYPQHQNITHHIILSELERELQIQESNLLLSDVQPDGEEAPRHYSYPNATPSSH